jgi:glycosyltransferase involved in cell wall biosynthesis
LVSVVVAFLNAERFLDEAIRGVIGQTRQDWELLLVDDGSSDGSAGIARGYAERDRERVRYLEHPGHRNLGPSAARELGLRTARGEYIALLDADDVWLPQKLERQVALLEAHPEAAMVSGAPLYWFGWTGKPEDARRDYVIDLKLPADRVYPAPSLLLPFLRREAPPPCPCDVLVRRAAALEVGGFEAHFRGPYQVYEDQAFFSKVLLRAPAFVSGETWDRYRQHPDSAYALAKASGTREIARRYYLTWFRRYLRTQGLRGGAVWDAVHAEFQPFRLRTRLLARFRGGLEAARRIARGAIPAPIRSRLGALRRGRGSSPRVRPVRFGSLRRLSPVSSQFGWDRGGLPVDRYYIEGFLARYANDIGGRVLECRDDGYTRRFGGDRVTRADVLHPTADNPKATIVADLARPDELPAEAFDCIVLTQVLPFIPDVPAAVRTLHRMLRPGGVLLATMPGISQIVRYDMDRWGDYWRFTSLSARRLFECGFPDGDVRVEAHGNVLAATAFLQGISSAELRPAELDHRDPDYEVLITVRAVKRAGPSAARAAGAHD